MHVCMLTYSFYESDTRIRQYSTALAKRGDSVDVIALRKSGQPRHEILEGINVYRIQERTVNERVRVAYLAKILRFLIQSTVVLGRMHRLRRYDVVHVHSVPDLLVFAAVFPKVKGARVILDIHDILPEFYASKFGSNTHSLMFKLLVFIERASIAFSDHTIVANKLWRERLLSRSVAADKCTAIDNYPDTEVFRPVRRKTNGTFRIVYPGTLNHHQGVDVALRAFARVSDQVPESEFEIYGDGPEKIALAKLSRDLGLSSRVHFHEVLPTTEIASIMAGADLAIVPKRASSAFGTEAASTKIMEFMAVGVPVIVSRTKIDSLNFDESMVRFFESENVDALANAIIELYVHPEQRRNLVEGGKRYVQENNWDVKQYQYLSVVDSLIGKQAHVSNRSNVA